MLSESSLRAFPYRMTIARQIRNTTITTTLRSGPGPAATKTCVLPSDTDALYAGDAVKASRAVRSANSSPAMRSLRDWCLPNGDGSLQKCLKKLPRRVVEKVVKRRLAITQIRYSRPFSSVQLPDRKVTINVMVIKRDAHEKMYMHIAPTNEARLAHLYSRIRLSGILAPICRCESRRLRHSMLCGYPSQTACQSPPFGVYRWASRMPICS